MSLFILEFCKRLIGENNEEDFDFAGGAGAGRFGLGGGAEGGGEERRFETTLSAGLTLTDGNSKTLVANASPSA